MKTLGLITARGGSKRVPGKNVRLLAGIPLIAWTCRAARASRLDLVILSSDDPAAIDICLSEGIEAPFVRPPELSSDEAGSLTVVRHALDHLGHEDWEAVMILQPTSPFRTAEDIDACLDRLSGADSVVTLCPILHGHPDKSLRMSEGQLSRWDGSVWRGHPRTQDLDPAWMTNGAVYLTRTEYILQGHLLGPRIAGVEMPVERSLDIDEELDFRWAEFLARS